MNAPEIEQRDSMSTLPVTSCHRRSRSSCLGEGTDIAILSATNPAIKIEVSDDSFYEGDTLVGDATSIASSGAKSHTSFDAKGWLERLATPDDSSPVTRSQSCDGRAQAQDTARTSLRLATKASGYFPWTDAPTLKPDHSKDLQTSIQANEQDSVSTSRLAPEKDAASVRSAFINRYGSRRNRSSSCSNSDRSPSQGHSELRFREVGDSLALNKHLSEAKEAAPSRDSNLAQKIGFETPFLSLLDGFNKLVRGCDAVERYNADPDACIATKKSSSERCRNPACNKKTRSRSTQTIRCFLDDMAKFHFTRKDRLSAQLLLRKVVELTVCSRDHRKEYYKAILEINESDFTAISTKNDNDSTSLTSALDKFNGLFPFAEGWFSEDTSKCLWRKANGGRCGRKIVAKNEQVIKNLFAALANLPFELHVLDSTNQIGKLAHLVFCGQQHRQKARTIIKESLAGALLCTHGESILREVVRTGGSDVQNESADQLLTTSPFRQGVVSDDTKEFLFKDLRKERSTTRRTIPKKRTGRVVEKYIPIYIPYRTIQSVKYSLVEWIQQQAFNELTQKELSAGYIYVYWNEAYFGARKIGYTTVNVDKRLDQWENQCGHVARKIDVPEIKVPHVKRLEKLIHAELREYRVVEPRCRGCEQRHREWFKDLDDDVLYGTIKKWTDWMMEKPYEKAEQGWVLKELAQKALPEVCKNIIIGKPRLKNEDCKAWAARRQRPFYPRAAKESQGQLHMIARVEKRKAGLPSSPRIKGRDTLRWQNRNALRSKDRDELPQQNRYDLRSKNPPDDPGSSSAPGALTTALS